MKLKTNNKFSEWLYKIACKFGYSPYLPKINTVYVTPRNLIELSCIVKVPASEYLGILNHSNQIDFINQRIYHEIVENATFKQNVKITGKFNPEDNTTTIYAKLFILDKKGLEDFYERY